MADNKGPRTGYKYRIAGDTIFIQDMIRWLRARVKPVDTETPELDQIMVCVNRIRAEVGLPPLS